MSSLSKLSEIGYQTVAVLLLIFIFFLSKYLIKFMREHPDHVYFGKYRPGMIPWAISLVIAVIGFNIANQTHQPKKYLLYFVISLIGYILSIPVLFEYLKTTNKNIQEVKTNTSYSEKR
jgi:uncharacterized membrane protein